MIRRSKPVSISSIDNAARAFFVTTSETDVRFFRDSRSFRAVHAIPPLLMHGMGETTLLSRARRLFHSQPTYVGDSIKP
jgi:hypothetical protein